MSAIHLRWAALASILLLTAGCSHGDPQGQADQGLVEVTVAKPLTEKVTNFEYFTGKLTAIPIVEIRARVDGYLDKVLFKDGQEVAANADLYVIDQRPYKAEVDRLTANVDRSKAAVTSTKAERGRQEQLLSQRATSRADYDKAVGFADEAVASLKSAEAALEKAKLDIDFTTVKSPIAGKMSNTNIDPGNLVTANKTLLTTVVAVDPIYVEFNIDERTVLEVQDNVRSKKVKSVAEADLPVWISLATDGPNFPYEARIDFIDNRVSTNTGTLKVRAVLPNLKQDGERRFTPGLFVRIKAPISDARLQLLIVDRAVQSDLDQKFIYVVNDEKKIERRPIKLGPLHKGLRVIDPVMVVQTKQGLRPAREGEKGVPSLKEGEWVVISGVQIVAPGSSVKTLEGKMAVDGGDPQ